MDDIKCIMYLCMLFILGFLPSLKAGVVSQIYIKDTVTPLKNSSLQIKCDVTDYTNNVILFESSTSNGEKKILNTCNNQKCLSQNKGGADYTVKGNTITIAITNLNRTTDQKYWWCQDKSIFLQIYTVPKTLQFDNPTSQDQDLALNSFNLKCRTGCSYPQPSFIWYYKEDDGSEQVWSTAESITNKADKCFESENIYTSTLTLGRYTTHPQNLNKIVTFLCGIPTFHGLPQPLYSLPSVNVHFAVLVTSVTLKDGVSTPSGSIQVISGVSKTLICESVSRPTATIVWYIANVEKQRSSSSSSFVFTPQNSDHNKQIYCKAFNLQSENHAVSSLMVTLYVQVRVTISTLKDGANAPSEPLQLVSGDPKTLTCVTSLSRPVPTILWYIGSVEKQRSNSSSNFTFTPQNSDHNKQIYCKAFNIQPERQADASVKTTLYVQGAPSLPKVFNYTGAIDDMPTFLLVGNLNGGYIQSFVVETAVAGTECWTERIRFNETDKRFLQNEALVYKFTLEGLSPNTYIVRVLAGNELGWIKETDAPIIQFHIRHEDNCITRICDSCNSTTSIILGGVFGLVVIVLLVYASYVTILLKRLTREKDLSKTTHVQANTKNTPTYVNLAYSAKTDGTEIESEDSGALAYTTLDKKLRDDKSTYDIIDTS